MKKTLFLVAVLTLTSPTIQAYQRDLHGFERVVGIISPEVLVLDNGTEVRLIGVDATEKKHPGRYFEERSKIFVAKAIQNERVRLQYDWVKRDPQGRPMVYVYRVPDDWFLNGEMVKEGHAFVDSAFPVGMKSVPSKPFNRFDEFKKYEDAAKKDHKGLWLTLDTLTKPRELV